MSIINGFGNVPEDMAYGMNRFIVPIVIQESDSYVFNLDIPFSYEINRILNIQGVSYNGVDSFVDPYININNTGNKKINGTIRNGKCYNMVWNGTEWIIQPTTLGVASSSIIITSSGTYTIDPDISYNLIAIGGGGGGAVYRSEYYSEYNGVGGGGSGGKIEDVFVPSSDTITVTVGAAGTNAVVTADYGNEGAATSGGNTQIDNFIAYGGKCAVVYGKNSEGYGKVDAGEGGSYSGGIGYNGSPGTSFSTNVGDCTCSPGQGWTINGVTYGKGGSYDSSESSYTITSTPTAGVIILTPIL